MPNLADVSDLIAVLLLLATVMGAFVLRLRQPLLVAFIAVGVLAGPSVLGWVGTGGQLHFLAELGLSLLLFVVGLKLDLSLIRTTGPVALVTGLGQIIATSLLGYGIALALGMSPTPALYTAIALTFSSTIIIIKLLSDKRETDSLHGRITVGVLIVQDIAVILAMIVLSGLAVRGNAQIGVQLLGIAVKGAILVVGLGLLMAFVLPRLMNSFARSSELLVLAAVTWAVVLAGVGRAMGFSQEVGAFLAGVSLASTPYRDILGARLVSLRDFLLLFFFVELGTRLNVALLGPRVWSAIPLSLFVLIGKPLIVMVIMGLMGYRKRTGLLTGLSLAQVSEFSLILAALGLQLGRISEDTAGLITLVGLITIGLSSYMILYSGNIYERLSPYLGIFERKVPHREQAQDALRRAEGADIILFGLGRYGSGVAAGLEGQGRRVLGVDFDPQAVRRWNSRGWSAIFGDAEDPEFAATLPLSGARWVISSLRGRDINTALIHALQSHGFTGGVAVTASTRADADALKDAGANLVFVPYTDAASQAVDLLALADRQEARRKMDNLIANLKDHYIICGYGRMGRQIAADFSKSCVPFGVVEHNPEQLPSLVEANIPHVEGKATEDEVLIKAGIERAKGLIAVTATDEENVFIVLTARGLNPDLYIVARSIQHENESKLRKAGADRVVSPYTYGGRRIAAAILKPRATDFLDLIESDAVDMDVEEITVSPSTPLAGMTAGGVREAAGVLVLAVKRDGTVHPSPGPDFTFEHGDEVMILGSSSQLDSAATLAATSRH